MGFIEDARQRAIETVFEVRPIKEARDQAVRGALDQYYQTIKGEWDNQLSAIQEANKEAINRAYEAGFYDGNDDPATSNFKAGGQNYKRISDDYIRDGDIDFQKAIFTAWKLWQRSPIAKRVLTMKRDHIIGHNAMPSAEDDNIMEVIKAFWMDNKLDKRAHEFVMQLFGFGEQCYPAFVRQSDGRVRIGYIDPKSIFNVEKHKENSLEDWAVVVDVQGIGIEKRVYRIIREDENYVDEETAEESNNNGRLVMHYQATLEPWEADMLKKYGRSEYDGSCFYFRVNGVSNSRRGMSDLLPVADWIDVADEVLFALGDREQFFGLFSWDVTLIGQSEPEVKKRAKQIRDTPPKKGSVNVHNDTEVWRLDAPDLGQTGTIDTFRAILGLILGGMGFPVHWYGFGDDANRATAVAQSDPTVKSLEHDQGVVKNMLLMMCQFAVDQASIVGKGIGDSEEYDLILNLPEVTTKDMGRISQSLTGLSQALTVAQEQGWLSKETAVKAWAKVMAELDIEIDPMEEMEKAEKEKEEKDLEREQQRNDNLARMLQQNGQGDSDEDEMLVMMQNGRGSNNGN